MMSDTKHFWKHTTFPKSIFTADSDLEINTVHTPYQFVYLILLTKAKPISTHSLSDMTSLDIV